MKAILEFDMEDPNDSRLFAVVKAAIAADNAGIKPGLDDETKKRLALLDALEAGGVDNWEWYHESTRHLFADEEDEDDAPAKPLPVLDIPDENTPTEIKSTATKAHPEIDLDAALVDVRQFGKDYGTAVAGKLIKQYAPNWGSMTPENRVKLLADMKAHREANPL